MRWSAQRRGYAELLIASKARARGLLLPEIEWRPRPAIALEEEEERHVARDETPHQFFQLAQERALRSARVSQNCVGGSEPSKKARNL
jgi:hypothetical protein